MEQPRVSIALTEQEWERIYQLLFETSTRIAKEIGINPWETREEILAHYIVERLPDEADPLTT